MAGLTALTACMIANPVGTIAGGYLADRLLGTNTLKSGIDAIAGLMFEKGKMTGEIDENVQE